MPTSSAPSRVPPNHAATSPSLVSTSVDACALANGAVSNTNSDVTMGFTSMSVGPIEAVAQTTVTTSADEALHHGGHGGHGGHTLFCMSSNLLSSVSSVSSVVESYASEFTVSRRCRTRP